LGWPWRFSGRQPSPSRHADTVAAAPTKGMWQLWKESCATKPASSSTVFRNADSDCWTSTASIACDGRVMLPTPCSERASSNQ
jgi:hypothetical protein